MHEDGFTNFSLFTVEIPGEVEGNWKRLCNKVLHVNAMEWMMCRSEGYTVWAKWSLCALPKRRCWRPGRRWSATLLTLCRGAPLDERPFPRVGISRSGQSYIIGVTWSPSQPRWVTHTFPSYVLTPQRLIKLPPWDEESKMDGNDPSARGREARLASLCCYAVVRSEREGERERGGGWTISPDHSKMG